ncbi:MAG TPA: hypothetical protein PLQ11_08935 [Beijerinckiaceae bacterium]|nr:hypothetical protein [Beijerinckiaceae bacterium]
MTNKLAAVAVLGLAMLAGPAQAQQKAPPKAGAAAPAQPEQPTSGPISLIDMKVQMFLERSGTWSENLVNTRKKLHNTVLGQGDAGEPADAVLVTLVFEGTKNTRGSDKLARDLAQVKVTQATKAGNKILLNRVYGGFLFGDNGLAHKAFVIDNATCLPLEIEAKIGRTRKAAKIEFTCDPKS